MRPALVASDDLNYRRNDEDDDMNVEYIVTGIIALLVGVYLMIALLRPDKF
ncbi:MAG: potassium-transporting ATPase subunit F, partial [Ktedonobacterales bacterium]